MPNEPLIIAAQDMSAPAERASVYRRYESELLE
jgi:hypothetical protein